MDSQTFPAEVASRDVRHFLSRSPRQRAQADAPNETQRSVMALPPRDVFGVTSPPDQVAEGYRARDERRAIKALLMP